MRIKTIMHSKIMILLASSIAKSDAIARTVKGKISPEVPASILHLH